MQTTKYEKMTKNNLKEKLVGDVLSALTITFFVSPCLVIVDKSVVQKTAGTHTIIQSVKETIGMMIKTPVKFYRSPMFLMMWGVYASTYSTANILKTLIEHNETTSDSRTKTSINTEYTKVGSFLATTFVNSSLSLMKDRAYATTLGKQTSTPKNFPMATFGIWVARDLTVIGSGFVLPEIMGKILQEKTDMDRKEALTYSQMICPVAAQLVATPLQLLGLDIYNRPMSNTSFVNAVRDRSSLIYQNFFPSLTIRLGRIVPGLGIGGVGNLYLRDSWREMVEKESLYAERATDLVRTFTMKSPIGEK